MAAPLVSYEVYRAQVFVHTNNKMRTGGVMNQRKEGNGGETEKSALQGGIGSSRRFIMFLLDFQL